VNSAKFRQFVAANTHLMPLKDAERVPKLYEGDEWKGVQFNLVVYEAFQFAKRFWNQGTIGYAIEGLTGFEVAHGRRLGSFVKDWWSVRPHGYGDALCDRVRPAYHDSYTEYYYERDLIAALLPRWRCSVCGRKPRVDRWGEPEYPPETEWQDRWHWKPREQFRRGDLDRTSLMAPDGMTADEWRVWVEQIDLPVCSLECHSAVAEYYRQEILYLREMKQWVTQGKKSLKHVKQTLRSLKQGASV
jgi:hypothetical protein